MELDKIAELSVFDADDRCRSSGKDPVADKDVDKAGVLPAVRDSGNTSAAATAGLPPPAWCLSY